MNTINSEKFGRICDGVWLDRISIQSGRGSLSGETALIRALYWRLCNAGATPGQSLEDCDEEQMLSVYQRLIRSMLKQYAHQSYDDAPYLKELVRCSVDEGWEEDDNTRAIRSVTGV